MNDIDFLVCKNCDSPCYVFELDARGGIHHAFCQVCGNDQPKEFAVPDDEDKEPDE